MTYIDGVVIPVPVKNKQAYIDYAKDMAKIFKAHGASRFVECWGDTLAEGKITSFPIAVKQNKDENVCFSWIEWSSKELHDSAMPEVMEEMNKLHEKTGIPFDGSRLIYGSFEMILEV